jgi:hypothetical protein
VDNKQPVLATLAQLIPRVSSKSQVSVHASATFFSALPLRRRIYLGAPAPFGQRFQGSPQAFKLFLPSIRCLTHAMRALQKRLVNVAAELNSPDLMDTIIKAGCPPQLLTDAVAIAARNGHDAVLQRILQVSPRQGIGGRTPPAVARRGVCVACLMCVWCVGAYVCCADAPD